MRTRAHHIGVWGTVLRLVLGGYMFGSVIYGHIVRGFHPLPWALGLLAFPLIVLLWHWLRIRRNPEEFHDITWPWVVVNFAVFWVLYLIPATTDAALIYYGTSILLAGTRGYSGCEILSISNFLLSRDDQIGCAVFTPVDILERRLTKNA